jgi:hypothetical protein
MFPSKKDLLLDLRSEAEYDRTIVLARNLDVGLAGRPVDYL